jgi:integrase
MASLIKRKNSSVWYAQYYVTNEDGKLVQVRKSTGIEYTPRTKKDQLSAKEKKAIHLANEMEKAAQGAMPADATEAEQLKTIYAQLGQEIARSTITVVSLRKCFTGMMRILTGEEMKIITIESWCKEWLERKARDSSKATMARYKGHVKAFTSWLTATRANKPLETVTTGDMEKWKRHLSDTGIVGKTVISYIKDIGSIYRAAVREGLISHSPVASVEMPNTDDSQERQPFTFEEVKKLMKSSPTEQWRGMILAAAFTGLRLGDAAKLQWSSVDLEKKMITLMPAKTKRKKRMVSIPIQPDLLAFFEGITITDDSPDAYVFPDLATLGISDRSGLSRTFISIMESAKVSRGKPSKVIADNDDDKDKGKGAGYITYERGFHSLRHTFTTWLRSAGVSEEDRMALTGHSTRDSHAIYSHTEEQVLRDAVAQLPSLTKPNKTNKKKK